MGMQCTFGYHDLQDQTQFDIRSLHNINSDTWTVEVWSKSTEDYEPSELLESFNLSVPEDKQADKYFCWFDVGSMSDDAMYSIRFLIRNRICFQCA
jgi:hypothetical protein